MPEQPPYEPTTINASPVTSEGRSRDHTGYECDDCPATWDKTGEVEIPGVPRCPDCGPVSPRIGMRFAYADPPYLGCGRKLYGVHHPDAARWDGKAAHLDLLAQLQQYDGWAYSCLPRDLVWVLPAVPGARLAVWVKPMCAWKPWQRIGQAWEPVVYSTPRTTVETGQGDLRMRDYLACPATKQRGLPGAKPEAFARWVLDLMGYVEGDELVDMFPGTAVLSAVAAQQVFA